jgi:site-specific DNA-methyltransferase (adenine-specific)
VLDPFAGSGSSLVAAQHLGRDWLGMELDPEHAATATRRLAWHGAGRAAA